MPMNAVLPESNHPGVGEVEHPAASSRARSFLEHASARWEHAQISNRSKYSDERMAELANYCARASLARVFAVIIFTPMPALVIVIIIECIPLQDPSDGWLTNFGAWARLFIVLCFVVTGTSFQIHGNVQGLSLSLRTLLKLAVATASGSVFALITISALWVFPLPFCLLLNGIPFHAFFVPLFRIAIRDQGGLARFGVQLKRQIYLIAMQPTLLVVYVGFHAIFDVCTPTIQTLLILVLPMIKFTMKTLTARMASHNVEAIPGVVVFTVEVFNAMYVSICMQTAASGWTTALVIALDIGQALLSLRRIYYKTTTIHVYQGGHSPSYWPRRLLSALVQAPQRFSKNIQNGIPVTVVHPVVGGAKETVTSPDRSVPILLNTVNRCINTQVVNEMRRMLFHSEYLVLVEYVECAIPILYAIYLAVLVHLPSAKYYPHSRSLPPEELPMTAGSLVLYGTLEALALIGLHVLLKRKFGFSPLYQLAFALETEVRQVQGRLFVWIPGILILTLDHFGMDLSFRFQWITDERRA